MTGSEQNREVVDILRDAANDFKLVRESFEHLLEEERREYEALTDDPQFEDLGMEMENHVDSLEDAIEELEEVNSSIEDAIEHMEDVLRTIDLLSR